MSQQQEDYERQIRWMVYHGKRWMDQNVGKVKVQFNFPRNVGCLMTIAEAVNHKLISLDGKGEEFIGHICCQTPGATVMMLKIALDLIEREYVLQKRV